MPFSREKSLEGVIVLGGQKSELCDPDETSEATMMPIEELTPELRAALETIYEEVMWLARRPNVTASRARAWYTHVMAESVKRQLRRFTGNVSVQAINAGDTDLRLEHFMRIQTTLTALVERHRQLKQGDAEEFVHILAEYERVHIVTSKENYDAMRAKGDYANAGINLVPWGEISHARRTELWKRMLCGKVANAREYAPRLMPNS